MTNDTTPRYIPAVETAKYVRHALKAAFPGVKFSVRTDKYAGGASVRVAWTDGPTDRQVRKVTEHYRGASFDGMTDSKSFHDTILAEGDSVEVVHFGAHFVPTSRTISPEFRAAAEQVAGALAPRLSVRDGDQCQACYGWMSEKFDGQNARVARNERGRHQIGVCSVECVARVEIRNGQLRPPLPQ